MRAKRSMSNSSQAAKETYSEDDCHSSSESVLEPRPKVHNLQPSALANSDSIERIVLPEKEPLRPMTLNLPDSMHRKLKELNQKTGRSKTEIVQLALKELFKRLE